MCKELGLGYAQSGTQTHVFNGNSSAEETLSGIADVKKWNCLRNSTNYHYENAISCSHSQLQYGQNDHAEAEWVIAISRFCKV